MRNAILSMLITATGTGIFTLHHFFNGIGIIWSVIMLSLIGWAYYFIVNILIHARSIYKNCKSYNELVRKNLGSYWSSFFNFFIGSYMILL